MLHLSLSPIFAPSSLLQTVMSLPGYHLDYQIRISSFIQVDHYYMHFNPWFIYFYFSEVRYEALNFDGFFSLFVNPKKASRSALPNDFGFG